MFSPLVTQSYTSAYNNTVVGDTVWANAASYESATYMGLTGNVQYGFSRTTGHQGHDMVGCSPERHGAMTGIMKAQIDWIPHSS